MTAAAEARAAAARYADHIASVVEDAPPIPAVAIDLLIATGLRSAKTQDVAA